MEDGGTTSEDFKARKLAQDATRNRQVFRLLLISTEPDLGSIRKEVAEYLRLSLGVDVKEAFDVSDISPYDLVVLIQAWWWSDGKIAQIWDKVQPQNRVSFVVDESADWPPPRLLEIPAYEKVKEFRSCLASARFFEKPENLKELIEKETTSRLQALQGDDRLGLKEWERRYLEFRLPAWRSGRTAVGQPHLFDAEQAQELYQPDLYIALDGV